MNDTERIIISMILEDEMHIPRRKGGIKNYWSYNGSNYLSFEDEKGKRHEICYKKNARK